MELFEEKVYLSKKKVEQEAAAWAAGSKSNSTVPVPFKLSESKPKPLPANDDPPGPVKAKPVPVYKPGPTAEELAIEQKKRENRERLVQPEPFQLKTDDRPMNTESLKAEMEAELQSTLHFSGPKAKPAPPPPKANVRLNTAAVLREDALYKRKQAKEAAMIQTYEMELRDAVPFETWKKDMRAADEAERQAQIDRCRQDAVESAENAIRIRKEQEEHNHEMAVKRREERKVQLQMRNEEEEVEAEANRQRREIVIEERERVKVAVEEMSLEKRERAQERMAERAEAEHMLAEIRAQEQKKKEDIIRQLRALERVQDTSKKAVFDPTTTAGHALLDEMSLTELQQRLQTAKRIRQEEEERNRAEIHRLKNKREEMVLSKAENIRRIRDMANTSGVQRRAERREVERARVEAEVRAREDGMLVLRDKLHAKKMEKLEEQKRLAAELKRIRFEQEIQAAGAAQLEEHKFKQLQIGAERELAHKQEEAKEEAEEYEMTRAKEWKIKLQNVKAEQRDKREFLANYNARVKAQQEQTNAKEAAITARKHELVAQEHARLAAAREKHPTNSNTHHVVRLEKASGHLPS